MRLNGLAGGGPELPIGPRRQLLGRNTRHTLGADGIFVRLARSARDLRAAGSDDALVEWRNAASCHRGHVRPDGYGVYRHHGRLYGFFLEYDRGTGITRHYVEKFAAYADCLAGSRFAQEYDGFPTILVVAEGPGPERRIADAVRSVLIARRPALPVLLTTTTRIDGDERGLLGPIWREPGSLERRYWPLPGFPSWDRSRCPLKPLQGAPS